jgi:nucleoside-diphosphate-sugar epimerase
VHCARTSDPRITITATRLLLERARAAGVRRVVHLSSAAVYGEAAGRVVETTAPVGALTPYAESKLITEGLCRDAAAAGLDTVILRPPLIYGPFGETWTVAYANRLVSGRWKTLGAAGAGRCNLLYVGDLVRAVQAALTARTEPGRAFNVNGPEIPTWNEYFERFNTLLTGRPLAQAGAQRGRLERLLSAPVRTLGKHVLKHHRPLLIGLSARSPAIKAALKRAETTLRMVPSPDEARLFRLDAVYDGARARAELDFTPTTGLDHGLALSVAWLVQNGLVPPRSGAAAERAPLAAGVGGLNAPRWRSSG